MKSNFFDTNNGMNEKMLVSTRSNVFICITMTKILQQHQEYEGSKSRPSGKEMRYVDAVLLFLIRKGKNEFCKGSEKIRLG
jgi:hypothetical protein